MKKNNIKPFLVLLPILCFLCFVSLAWNINAYSITSNATTNNIVIIYDTDDTIASQYQSFLTADSYDVDLIPINDIPTTSFSNYDLIIIDPLSGAFNSWGNTTTVNAIKSANKPIIGLSTGGYGFFGELGFFIGYPYGATGSGDSLYVPDTPLSIFQKPNSISNGTLQIYTSSTSKRSIYTDSAPENITVLATDSEGSLYSPLIQEADDYILWGFYNGPDDMTFNGLNLFENVIVYLLPEEQDGIPGYDLYLFLGISALAIITIIGIKYRKKNFLKYI
ncbi:MAG: hypothetical protein ACQERB_06170 [Promethearchaeati archaeon]